MGNKVAELAIHVTSDIAGDIAGKFGDIGHAAVGMSDDVEKSSSRAAGAVDKLGGASDGLDDKFGRAAGAAGALSSGADLIGNEKASAALQAMALATDFFSGVGQVGILVTEALSAATVENEAATVSQTIAQRAAGVAAKGWAIAQGALNAVMSANPIILVVLAVLAIVVAFKLAYDHSAKFREIVQAVGKVGAAALNAVLGVIKDVVSWVGRVGDKFGILGQIVHVYVFVAKTEIALVVAVVRTVIDIVGDLAGKFGDLKDKVVNVIGGIRDKLSGGFSAILHPFTVVKDTIHDIIDLIDDLIDKISHIHIPHPDLNPFNGKSASSSTRSTGSSSDAGVVVYFSPTITVVEGAGDTETADAIVEALSRSADRLGVTIAQRIGVPA